MKIEKVKHPALGPVVLNGTPRLVVGFTDTVSAETARAAFDHGVDIAELRIDQFSSHEESYVLAQVGKFRRLPTIATIRTGDQGGRYRKSSTERLRLFQAIIGEVDAVDVELAAEIRDDVVEFAAANRKLALVSFHDFEATPSLERLLVVVDEAKAAGADVVKVATMVQTMEDVQTLARLTLSRAHSNVAIIGMGALGVLTRVFLPALGSLLTYAYIGQPTAPGQLDADMMFEQLRLMYPSFNEEKIRELRLVENY
ncbi:MAG TPA: type I 3-dehydroquinate dehydratase [Candidatus Binatia bacterium]|jgi:3-dehydroquinate dehydratase-1